MTDSGTRTGFVDANGARIAFDEAGSGLPVILVHAGIADRRMWDDVWADLATRYRVVRYDCRGFGETAVVDPQPFSNRVDLIAVLDHLGIERAVLVGVSRAGSIVTDTALEFPDRALALVRVAAGLSGFEVEPTPKEQAVWDRLEALEAAGDLDALNEAEIAAWVDGLTGTRERVPGVRSRVLQMNADVYRLHADEQLGDPIPLDPPAAVRLGSLRIPVLEIVGDLDMPETLTTARHVASVVPGARLEVLEGVTHLPPMERPAEFVRLLDGFLASLPSWRR